MLPFAYHEVEEIYNTNEPARSAVPVGMLRHPEWPVALHDEYDQRRQAGEAL